jgi:TolA-binding protein
MIRAPFGVFAAALAIAPVVRAQDDGVAESGAEIADIRADLLDYHATEERFRTRMSELDGDTRRFFTVREEEERVKLTAGYDQLIDTLSDMEQDNRVLTRERMEYFLQTYPNAIYASHVRFRLADLLFVAAKLEWEQAMAEYAAIEGRLIEEERWDEIPPEPKTNLQPAIDLYLRIIADNKDKPASEQYENLDGAYYMLGFCLFEATSGQRDESAASRAFVELTTETPDSPLVDAARLFLGNIHFERNELQLAIDQYQTVYDRGPEGKYYDDALYQLAWTYFKMSGPEVTDRSLGRPGFDLAMGLFTKILDLSEVQRRESGRDSNYAPDALKYMAISFSDIADFSDVSALSVGRQWFDAQPGEAAYEWGVYHQLGEALIQQARFAEAIEVFRFLQDDPRWTLRPENPALMWRVAELHASERDFDAAAAAVVQLTERYNEESPWWEANRTNPEALEVARKHIEESLADVAIDYHLKAQQTGNPDDYMAAAAKYREYLRKFPISDDFYEKQQYLADSLFNAKHFDEALAEYESLIKSSRHHPYLDIAVVRAAESTRLRMEEAVTTAPDDVFEPEALTRATESVAPRWTVPAKGFVESTETLANGQSFPIYALSDWHEEFVATTNRAIGHTYTEPAATDDAVLDLRDFAAERQPKLIYLVAQLHYVHNRYADAEPLLLRLMTEYPQTMEASYAAGMHVNMYLNRGDLAKVRELSRRYLVAQYGPPNMPDPTDFGSVLEGVSFKQCLDLVQLDREEAATCFLGFYDEFPDSEHRADALYNAGNSYDIIGNKAKSIELFERYVATYPTEDRSRALFFRIAANYESTLELDKAIDYYERLLSNFPDDRNAADALYNASFLKIGLGRNAEAARGFEKYGTTYDTLSDAEETFWRAAEQWEAVGEADALSFYERYLRTYGMRNPDHVFEAKQRSSEIHAAAGRDRKAEQLLDEIDRDFATLISSGRTVGVNGRHYAAAAGFREVQAAFERVTANRLSGNEERDGKLILEDLPVQLQAFDEQALAFVAKYADFEYSTAAMTRIGQAYLYYADLGFSLEPPESFSDELKDAWQEVFDAQVRPGLETIETKGKDRLVRVVDFARERKRYSTYVGEAQRDLNERDPRAYPAVKEEVRGETLPSTSLDPAPMELPAETTSTPEENAP